MRTIKHCEICKRKITFFNTKTKRKDNRIICKKCLKAAEANNVKSFDFKQILLSVKDIEMKYKIMKEEKKITRKMSVHYKNRRGNSFSSNIDNKVLKYVFPSITIILDSNFAKKSVKSFTDMQFKEENGLINFYNGKTDHIGHLYKGTLNEYLKKIILRESYVIDYCFREINEKSARVSLAIYTDIVNKKKQEGYLLKTAIVKTQNTHNDKEIQSRIAQLKKNDILYLSYENNKKIIITDDQEQKMGELPHFIVEYLYKDIKTSYIGVVDQVYRCANGLKTFDIFLLPVENGG